MNEKISRELRCAAAARSVLAKYGITYQPAVMVLFDMVLEGCTYRQALADWTAFKETWGETRWQSEICFRLLQAGIEERAGNWFAARAREAREIAN